MKERRILAVFLRQGCVVGRREQVRSSIGRCNSKSQDDLLAVQQDTSSLIRAIVLARKSQRNWNEEKKRDLGSSRRKVESSFRSLASLSGSQPQGTWATTSGDPAIQTDRVESVIRL